MDRSETTTNDAEEPSTIRTAPPHASPVVRVPGPMPASALAHVAFECHQQLELAVARTASIVETNKGSSAETLQTVAAVTRTPSPEGPTVRQELWLTPGAAPEAFLPSTEARIPSAILATDAQVPASGLGAALQAPSGALKAAAEQSSPETGNSEANSRRYPQALPSMRPEGQFNRDLPRGLLQKVARVIAYAIASYGALVLALTVLYRFVDPPMSALMLQQRLFGQDIIQDWVPLERISPNIIRAVLVSEDGRFCQHNGVDFEEMQAAIERSTDGPPRGASTISMQVVKNLYLWPSKSYLRKAVEIPLTYLMELIWSKARIMEVYLNIAEWGPGIFGVEAASQFHFNRSAAKLGEREAARLAVALPNPFMRDAGEPGPQTLRLAGEIQSRMRAAPESQTACVLHRPQ